MPRRRFAGQRGFTLIELIAVLIIVGVLAIAAIPRFFDKRTFDERSFSDQVISALRYAQKTAVAQHRFVCVSFPSSSTMTLTYGSSSACTNGVLVSPSNPAFPIDGKNIVFTSVPSSFSFDCLGRPRKGSSGTCDDSVGAMVAADPALVIQIPNMPAITVEKETGYVH